MIETAPRMKTPLLFLAALAASGCAWAERSREVRPAERLQLESAVVPAPADPGWRVGRTFDAGARRFTLGNAKGTRALTLGEADRGAPPLTTPEERAAWIGAWSASARHRLADPAATISELESTLAPRFGSAAVLLVLRAEESDAQARLHPRRVLYSAQLAFVPPEAPDRTCAIEYDAVGVTDELTTSRFEESWHALLDDVELRPATRENVAAAARADEFPKQLEPGLARRSLTLPRGAFQGTLSRTRPIGPGGFDGSWGLAVGITDRLELAAPGFVQYSLGEPEALTRPELALGAGLTGFEHDATRGSAWGFGASASARRRFAADLAWRGLIVGELVHESRTGRDRPGGVGTVGVVWDVGPWASLGLEAGWSSEPWLDASSRLVWVGGASTPLVTVHLPPLDLGLLGAAAWDRGSFELRAGFGVALTL